MSTNQEHRVAQQAARAAVDASWPQTRVILRVVVILLMVAITIWILIKLTGVILLLVLSIFFAYLVAPLVEFVSKPIKRGKKQFRIPRVVAISLVYVIIIAAIVLTLMFVVPRVGNQFPEFAEQARVYWRTVREKTQGAADYMRFDRLPEPARDAVGRAAGSVGENVNLILAGAVTWLAYIPWLILIPILSFFLLKDAESFRRSLLQMLPKGRWRWRGDEFFQDISTTLAAYTRAQLTACLFIGIACALIFTLLGVPSPLALGFFAGLFEFVPLVGPLLVATVAAIAAAFHAGLGSALLVLLFLGVLRIVQDYFVYPRLIGQGIHLHPLAVIIAILSGAELAGVTGIVLAIPVVAIVTVSYRHWLEHRGSEGLADLLDPNATATVSEGTSHKPTQTQAHPSRDTTPEEMARARPDLTTGELKVPNE